MIKNCKRNISLELYFRNLTSIGHILQYPFTVLNVIWHDIRGKNRHLSDQWSVTPALMPCHIEKDTNLVDTFSANTRLSPKVGSMLAHRLRSWYHIESILGERLVFAG